MTKKATSLLCISLLATFFTQIVAQSLERPTRIITPLPPLVKTTLQAHPIMQPPKDVASTTLTARYYRPAGGFTSNIVMEDGSLVGSFQAAEVFIKPYADYTWRGEASNMQGVATYDWAVQQRVDGVRQWSHSYTQELTTTYGYEYDSVPILTVMDDVTTSTFMMQGYEMSGDQALRADAARVNSLVSTEAVWGETFLKSSKNFSYGGLYGDQASPMTYSDGATPYGSNSSGWWYGKNGSHIDGIAQAFETPQHPYLLKQVVLLTAFLNVTATTELTCHIYRLNEIPAYDNTTSVTLSETPGTLIATGSATVTSSTYNSTGGLVVFNLADGYVTIDSPILVAIEGYNDDDMIGISDFSAFIASDIHVDEGFGELAYLKQGTVDATTGNITYQWKGLNNYFDASEMKTGLSIFLSTELPYLTFHYTGEDGTYTFADEGGTMVKNIPDADTVATTHSIEFYAWTPYSSGKWTHNAPEWLNVTLADADSYSHGGVTIATVTAQPLPSDLSYREAQVRFSYPGAFIDYVFKQGQASTALCGDVNSDGLVTIADINAIIGVMLGIDVADADLLKRADVNNDSEVSIADINTVIGIMLE